MISVDEHSLATATSTNETVIKTTSTSTPSTSPSKRKGRRKPKYLDIMCSQMETQVAARE